MLLPQRRIQQTLPRVVCAKGTCSLQRLHHNLQQSLPKRQLTVTVPNPIDGSDKQEDETTMSDQQDDPTAVADTG